MQTSTDDVSRLQGRYSLTLLSPSSRYFSLCLSVGMAVILSAVTVLVYLDQQDQYWRIGATVAVLLATQYVDARYIRHKEYSKSLHSSAFGCSLWVISLAMGVAAATVTSGDLLPFFVVLGVFLLASFRISIYTTVLGCRIGRAWAICFVQPVAVFVVMVPADMWAGMVLDPVVLGYGAAYLGCATAWSVLTDRAGRPAVKSTHTLVQAYIDSQGGKQQEIEGVMEENSTETGVLTTFLRFRGQDESCIVLPEVHPGPYHPVGGSNIPYLIYEKIGSRAMVMHSISDHALNIPSHRQVDRYLESLTKTETRASGSTCTEPVVALEGKSRVTGISFGKNALLFMSLSPYGMEDLPSDIKAEADRYASDYGFDRVMLVDCHNAMGPEISGEDHSNMLRAARSCLERLSGAAQHPLEVGYANSGRMDAWSEDVGMGGMGLLCLGINGSRYYIGWADSNNMENGIRESVVGEFTKTGRNLLEICTSDTHYNPVKPKNRHGYYQFGLVAGKEKVARWYLEMAGEADAAVSPSSFEIAESGTNMLLMGSRIFEHYSKAMDRSMNLVKIFMTGCTALFLSTLLV